MKVAAPPRTAVPASRPTPRLLPFFAIGLLLTVGAFAMLAWPFAPHTVDDAWITFRYSRQWALGHGPYFNPGEHVEGYSNFLMMLLMTPVIAWGGADAALPAAKAIGLLSAILCVLGAGVLARRAAAGSPWADAAGMTAAGLVALVPGFSYHAFSGLETSFYAALLTWGVIGLTSATERARAIGGLALAAAAITRPEAPILFALAWVAAALAAILPRFRRSGAAKQPEIAPERWRPLLFMAIAGTVAILGQVAFRHWAYDGEWVPNTYFAKLGGAGDRMLYVARAAGSMLFGPIGLLASAVGVLARGRAPMAWWAPALLGAVGLFLPLAIGGDWMPGARFVMPYVPFLAVATACGFGRLLEMSIGGGAFASILLLLTLPLSFALHRDERGELERRAAIETLGARTGHEALAAWIRTQAKPADTVVLMDIGEVGYRCIEQRILDITGLTDRTIAKSPGIFLKKDFDLAYVFDQDPEFIVLTLAGAGDPLAPLDPRARLRPFSTMELRLATHPVFERNYVGTPDLSFTATDPLEAVRRRFGAEAVFPYATPGFRYLLLVYRRHP